MREDSALGVHIPKFDEGRYLDANPDAKAALDAGEIQSGLQHFLRVGVDENRAPQLKRTPVAITGAVERAFVSDSGYFLLLGWLSDEGHAPPRFKLFGGDFNLDIPEDCVFRHARKDVEAQVREGAFDFGFRAFGRCPSKTLLFQPLLVQTNSSTGAFQARITPEVVSDKRLLDTLLTLVATDQSHAGKEAGLHAFFAGAAGAAIVELFSGHVAANIVGHYVETFGARPVDRTFVSVLFGSTEAILLQPVLFLRAKIDFGQWIYVCNSPEDASAALRLGKLISDLYDVMITIIVMTDNVGFGAANNAAVMHAASDSIYVINPDVYPLPAHADILRETLRERDLGVNMWGGLLFYDNHNLMHSGMHFEQDVFFRCSSFNKGDAASREAVKLARVEHFDKGAPFEEARWREPKVVPAITGALMAFRKPCFEKLGGFSTRYIYGHYEDADLSLRWADAHGPVIVDPGLRLVHLEGQGSRARGEQYRGAAMTNRYLFSLRHADILQPRGKAPSWARDLSRAGV